MIRIIAAVVIFVVILFAIAMKAISSSPSTIEM